ncbi:MAG: hypothetical protein Q7P63_13450 [Verrucomicrobiota bacterium JB022]|nr:hypothetical protein [Verrucomicrobiota bacterium JB022]
MKSSVSRASVSSAAVPSPAALSETVHDTRELFRVARELGLDARQVEAVERLLTTTHRRRQEIDYEWRAKGDEEAFQMWWRRLTDLHRWVDQEIERLLRPEQYGTWRRCRELRLTLVGTHQLSA